MGANAIPIRHSSSRRMPSSNSNSHPHQSVFTRLDYRANLLGSYKRVPLEFKSKQYSRKEARLALWALV